MAETRTEQLVDGPAFEHARARGRHTTSFSPPGRGPKLELLRDVEVDYYPQALDVGQGLQVLPGGVVPLEASNYDYIGSFAARQLRARGVEALPAPQESYAAPVCILGNLFARNFTHWHEELLKVMALEHAQVDCTYVLSELPRFATVSLELLGIDPARVLQVRTPTRFERAIYTTSVSYINASDHPGLLLYLRQRLIDAVGPETRGRGERLWLDRGEQTRLGRRLVNAEAVYEAIARRGFQRVDMGALPLREQIAAARDLRVLAGPHGSAFVHAQLMPPRSHVIEAFSPLYLNPTYTEIYRVMRHRYSQLGITNTPVFPYPHGGDVEIDMQQLELALDNLDD